MAGPRTLGEQHRSRVHDRVRRPRTEMGEPLSSLLGLGNLGSRNLLARHPRCQLVFRDLQEVGCISTSNQVDGASDDPRPSRLVTGAQSRAVVTMKIFVEQDVILPVRVFL